MDTFQPDNLYSIFFFLIPGFITLKTYDSIVPSDRKDTSKSVIELIAYGGINFIIIQPILISINTSDFFKAHPSLSYFSVVFLFLVLPILWPKIYLTIISLKFLSKYVRHPFLKPWDFKFNQKKVSYIIVHLKNGRKIGGEFKDNSFASSSPAEEQIYLETVYELDENEKFKAPIERSKGIIILRDEISAIEFFE
jgi:hypothetical protein